jgi:hypothetical protein
MIRPPLRKVIPTIVKHDIYGMSSEEPNYLIPTEEDLDPLIKDYSESTFSEIDTNALKKHFNIDDFEEKYGT